MKECFKCNISKEPSEFYKHKQMSGGLLGKCKVCTNADNNAYRLKNIERAREYDRSRGSRRTPERQRLWRARYPNKRRAHQCVAAAVSNGKIKKPTDCQDCGSDFHIVAHHCDYSKPLDVMWLCSACHSKWHVENGEGLNG